MAETKIILKSDLAAENGNLFLNKKEKQPAPGSIFDMGAWMQDKNINLLGTDADGNVMVEDLNGKVGVLDTAKVLADNRLDPKSVTIQYNNPSTALDDSPISIPERLKLALGNERGQLNYLRKKFGDVAIDPTKGITVKDKGVWKVVDKSGMDPWEVTADLMEGAISLAPGVIGGTAGAIAGAAVGGAPGSIAGAGLGAGALEGIRGTLGRAVGTYDATPEEELRDIGYEALLNMGGQAVALGAKPALKALGAALKNISGTGAEISKNIVAESLGRTTGAGAQAIRTAIDAPEEVIAELAKHKGSANVVENLFEKQLEVANSILTEAPQKLSAQYGTLKRELIKEAQNIGKVDVGNLATNTLKSWEASGLITADINKKTGETIYKLIDDKAYVALNNLGRPAELLTQPVRESIEPLIKSINTFSKLGSKSGSEAAATLMDLQKNINAIVRDGFSPSASPTLKSILAETRKTFNNGIAEVFNAHGLGDKYSATGALYERFADAVNMARRLSADIDGNRKFINRLTGGIKANFTYQELTKDLVDLLGASGAERIKRIGIMESAKGLSSYLPSKGISVGAGLGTFAFAGPAALPALGALSSPKLVLNAISTSKKGLSFLRGLSPLQRQQLLGNPAHMEAFIRTLSTTPASIQQASDTLTNRATGGQ